jgi:hypothetical protein
MKESQDSFLPENLLMKPEQRPSVARLIEAEFLSDVESYFPGVAMIVRKRCVQGIHLNPIESSQFDAARNKWWQEKYGFPFFKNTEREELIRQKYDMHSEEDRSEKMKIFTRLVEAVDCSNEHDIAMVRNKYLEQYPDQLEGVTALFEFIHHLDNDEYLSTHDFRDPNENVRNEMRTRVEEATQYAFLITHYILENGHDKEFLSTFWRAIELIAQKKEKLKRAHQLQRGVLSQVATHRIFETLGMNPSLSHPKEDAFKKVDLWVEGKGAVQVKGTKNIDEELFVSTDQLAFPGTQIDDGEGGGKIQYEGYLMRELKKFQLKIDRYAEEINTPIKGYVAVIPYHEFDLITGEPNKEIIKRSAESLGIDLIEGQREELERTEIESGK